MEPTPTDEADAYFAEQRRREERLHDELAAAPIAEISGVIHASGGAGCQSQGQKLWTFVVSLLAWRVNGGPVRTQELTLRRELPKEQLDSYREVSTPYSVQRFKARLKEGNSFGTPQALMEELLGPDPDPELHQHSIRLQQPVTFEDPTLGTFTLDRRINRWQTRSRWIEQEADLWLGCESPDDRAAALRTAHALWQDQPGWHRRVTECAAAELLALRNETWRTEDEPELSPEELMARMSLESIEAERDGKFGFSFTDGDLFGGHWIRVSGNLDTGPTQVDIEG